MSPHLRRKKRETGMFRVFITGGGTGGHLFPGISLAEAIRAAEPDADIRFLISGKKLDTALLENRGFPCLQVEQRHIPKTARQILDFMATNARAVWQVIRVMLRARPDVVVGLGGYASFATAAAAKLCAVPLVLLEQNVIPGKANRALALAASRVFCQWPQAARYFMRRDNLTFSGNPVRETLRRTSTEVALRKLGLAPGRRTLLVLGGSQGANALNKFFLESLPVLKDFSDQIQIIHLAGKSQSEPVSAAYQQAGIRASVHNFLEEMQLAYSAADLALCRAGGTTIAELTALGLPSILVPYPHSAQNHQMANAKEMVSAGAARLLQEQNLSPQAMKSCVLDLLFDEKGLARMAYKAALLGQPRAAAQIAEAIVEEYKTEKVNSIVDLLKV